MMKKILLILLPMALAFAPLTISAQNDHEGIEASVSGAAITANGSNVRIVNANGETLEIFNITGLKISSVRIDSADKSLNLNLPKGCYLLKIGKVVRKISIK